MSRTRQMCQNKECADPATQFDAGLSELILCDAHTQAWIEDCRDSNPRVDYLINMVPLPDVRSLYREA